jgi:hypothetical protein
MDAKACKKNKMDAKACKKNKMDAKTCVTLEILKLTYIPCWSTFQQFSELRTFHLILQRVSLLKQIHFNPVRGLRFSQR